MGAPSKEFNAAEFRATLERMSKGTDHGLSNLRPSFDRRDQQEVAAEAIKGRKIADYKQALEALGFRFIQAHQLAPYPDGRPHEHGEWRCNQLRMAWTDSDILAYFKTPKELWEYVNKHQLRKRAARSGLILR